MEVNQLNKNIEIVAKLYLEERMLKELKESTMKCRLKIWEKEVATQFPNQAWILDIGCGMGREAFYLNDTGFKITAIDISEKAIEWAKQLSLETNRKIEFMKTNGLDLPFQNNVFDIVIIWNQTFGLFYGNENQTYILKECHRVLKKNGILSFSGHSKTYVEQNHHQYVDGKKFFAITNTDCYWELFTEGELAFQAEKVGFTVLGCKEGGIYNEDEGKPILHCECRK